MILLMTLGCFLSDPIDDPMCDAICDEQSEYNFSKSLESYSLEVSFKTDEGEETIEVAFDGDRTEGYAQLAEVSVRVDADGVGIYASHGTFLSDIVFTINDVTITPSFISSEPNEVCGSVCTSSVFDLNTDSVEEQEAESTMIDDLEELIARLLVGVSHIFQNLKRLSGSAFHDEPPRAFWELEKSNRHHHRWDGRKAQHEAPTALR